MEFVQYIWISLGALTSGYVIFLGLAFVLLPRRLNTDHSLQRQMLLKEAKRKCEDLREEERNRIEQKLALAAEELESTLESRRGDLEAIRADLDSRAEYAESEEKRLQKRTKDLDHIRGKVDRARHAYEQANKECGDSLAQTRERLAGQAATTTQHVLQSLKTDMVESRQLECTKYVKILAEDLKTSAARMGSRVLSRVHSRYEPNFVWPKGVSHVEIKDAKNAEILAQDNHPFITQLVELAEDVNISVVTEDTHTPLVRLGGGYGIYKEAAKLTLEKLVNHGPSAWKDASETYEKYKSELQAKAFSLGKTAVRELQLQNMHAEILRMVGALNWRTSYRQNQFHHSLEVAKLAGILANELGVDPDLAKRCGLLHDIGKGIDYRIEGSHAVISGDYADRFGESKTVCDTVMSHHADLIVETPLAYVLMSADTLSGARPGARVNLEEGYQDRLSSIEDVIRNFPGVTKIEIMNGAREVHVEVNHKKVKEADLTSLSSAMARQIEENVAYPGQIKVLVTRRFESVAVA